MYKVKYEWLQICTFQEEYDSESLSQCKLSSCYQSFSCSVFSFYLFKV